MEDLFSRSSERPYLITSPEMIAHPISITVILCPLMLLHQFLGIYWALKLCYLFAYLGSINIEIKKYRSLKILAAILSSRVTELDRNII